MKRTIIVVAVTFSVVVAAGFVYRRPAVVKAAVSQPVQERLIAGAGRVEPASEEIKIGSEVDARLAEVPVEEGQRVRRGQVVAVLENADLKARLDLMAATVVQREAELERLVNGSRVEARREAEAAMQEAEAELEHAKLERSRRSQLAEYGAISRAEFDLAERALNVAKARVEASRAHAALVNDESRSEDIKRARAEVERAQALTREARALLEKTIIRSPIDGVVLRKKLKEGESAAAGGDAIVTLGDCSKLRVRVDVDENDVGRLQVGQAAWVRADAYGDRKFHGKVTRIGQILGRKNVRTDEPTERVDAKILETMIELEPGTAIPVGMRVDAYIEPRS